MASSTKPIQLTEADERRLWSKVRVNPENGCWERGTPYDPDGYVLMWLSGNTRRAARIAWRVYYGVWPAADQLVCHHCDNPKCVRKSHLFLGSPKDNNLDKARKLRSEIGVRNRHAKLDEVSVLQIRNSDAPTAALAARFGVSRPSICNVRARRTWRHV